MAAEPRPSKLVVERNLKRFCEIDFNVVIQQHEKHHLFFVEQRNLDEEHDPHIRINQGGPHGKGIELRYRIDR